MKDPRNGPVKTVPIDPLTQGSDESIDGLLREGLSTIRAILWACKKDVANGNPSRASVQNFKDAMTLLQMLKEKEKDILEDLTDEELKVLADGQ